MNTILAHAGHGQTATNSLTHYLLEPGHLFFNIAALIAIAAVIWYGRQRLRHSQAGV